MLLQTTGGFDSSVFQEALFPLGPWCLSDSSSNNPTALNLPDDDDLSVEATSAVVVEHLEAQIYPVLNKLHEVTFPHEVWHHSLGTYLRVLTPLVVIRYNLIRRVIRTHGVSGFTSLNIDTSKVLTADRSELLVSVNSHAWNHVLLAELCKSLGLTPRSPSKETAIEIPDPLAAHMLHANNSPLFKTIAISISNILARRSRTVITRTMLPLRMEFSLARRLKTFPLFWGEEKITFPTVMTDVRQQLVSNVKSESEDVATIMRAVVGCLPRVFVEDFAIARKTAASRLPKAPLRVFTANLHQASDTFLIWLSEQRHYGTRVMIAQHGGVHSLCRDIPADISAEIELADRYLAWGERLASTPNVSSGPTLVNIGRKRLQRSAEYSSGPLLIVLDASYRYPSIPRGMNGSRFDYARMIDVFIQALDPKIVPEIMLRPYRGAEIWDDSITDLLTPDRRVSIDRTFPPIDHLYKKSRMVVSTSLGTTFFQTVHHGIPSVFLADPTLSPLSTWAMDALQPLWNNSVAFDDPRMLATHLNHHFFHAAEWWGKSDVQSAIKKFEDRMSPTCDDPVSYFAHELLRPTADS